MDPLQRAILHSVVEAGCADLERLLLQYSGDINQITDYGVPLLEITVANELVSCTELLLRYGADPNIRNRQQQTPIYQCSTIEMCELLLNRGAIVDTILIADFVARGERQLVRHLVEQRGVIVDSTYQRLLRNYLSESPVYFIGRELLFEDNLANYNVNMDELDRLRQFAIEPTPTLINKDMATIIQENPEDLHVTMLYEGKIFKFEQYAVEFNQVLNESLIGFLGLNTLDSPHFAKVLAVYPEVNCHSFYESDKCAAVVYEYINGITYKHFLKREFQADLVPDILRQVIEALYLAYRVLDFTHYDLHGENILLTPEGRAVMIDYGSSHIKLGGKNYGRTMQEGRIVNRSRWYHDVWKLLLYTYGRIYHKSPPALVAQLTRLLEFFQAPFDHDFYIAIQEEAPYFVPTAYMLHYDNYDFPRFLELMHDVLR